jgi:RND family efflux transporter MFP subunit
MNDDRSDTVTGMPAAGGARRLPLGWLLLGLMLAAVAATIVFGIQPKLEARADLSRETSERNVLTVSVIRPRTGDPAQELVLPGNVQAYRDTPIHARTGGYLKRWHYDIGARVKKGDLLAEIDAPEIDDQLLQARAELANAEAAFSLADKTAVRWEEMLRSNAVSRQETDEKLATRDARKAVLDAARFNVARLEKLASFKRVHAAFDGVITARNTDVGALIDPGGNGGAAGRELFHLSSTDRLRVFVSVPQAYSRQALSGVAAELTLAEYPGRRFPGKLARTAQAIDPVSRTLLAEIAVENPTGELLPGAYAEVHLKFASAGQAMVLPVNTLLFRPEGVQVGVVGPDQTVVLTKVTLGRDFGTTIEIVSGLDADASVILNPVDSLTGGARVRVVKEGAEAAKPAEKAAPGK